MGRRQRLLPISSRQAREPSRTRQGRQNHKILKKQGFSLTEPILARFGRKETKGLQRPILDLSPVSEVRSPSQIPLKPSKKHGPFSAIGPVRDGNLADEVDGDSKFCRPVAWRMRGGAVAAALAKLLLGGGSGRPKTTPIRKLRLPLANSTEKNENVACFLESIGHIERQTCSQGPIFGSAEQGWNKL